MTDAIAQVLNWLYGIWPSYAGSIVLLTLIIMVLVTPLTLKSTRSMMQMQKFQPEIKKLQAQYRDDRQRLNEELMAFYKEHSINPMGGCLPLLVQMPVFFALYSVLRGLTRRVNDTGFDLGWVAGQLAQGLQQSGPPNPDYNFDPAYLGSNTDLYQSLSQTNEMRSWGLDLSESASDALGQGIVHALPYFALIAVVAVTGVVQQRQIQGRNPNAEVNPQQQMIMKFMPIMLPVFSFALPAGLVLYFAVSNSYRCGQQWWISRSIYGITKEDRLAQKAEAAEAKTTKTRGRGGDDVVELGKGRPTPKRGEPKPKSSGKSSKATSAGSSPKGGGKTGGRGAEKSDAKKAKQSRSNGGGGGRSSRTPETGPKPAAAQPRARKRKR